MSRHVIIHLPRVGEDRASWTVADEAGRLIEAESSGTLAEAAEAVEGRRATLVVPGDDVLLAEAVVPGASPVRAQQAVPFALEEQLADDVERLHFALGTKGKGGRLAGRGARPDDDGTPRGAVRRGGLAPERAGTRAAGAVERAW